MLDGAVRDGDVLDGVVLDGVGLDGVVLGVVLEAAVPGLLEEAALAPGAASGSALLSQPVTVTRAVSATSATHRDRVLGGLGPADPEAASRSIMVV